MDQVGEVRKPRLAVGGDEEVLGDRELLEELHRLEGPPQPLTGAALELANHLWRSGQTAPAIAYFNECHRLQPDNWTYKRQAWSTVSNERVGGDYGRFAQGPIKGEEDNWPFASDFWSDIELLREGEYYPSTMKGPDENSLDVRRPRSCQPPGQTCAGRGSRSGQLRSRPGRNEGVIVAQTDAGDVEI